jgi:hypothetical protein
MMVPSKEGRMKPRLSILGLMAVVAIIAVGFSAMRSGSDPWFRAVYTMTVVVLLAAAIAARSRGAFWFGFASVGWGYFLLGLGSTFNTMDSNSLADRAPNHNLLTNQVLRRAVVYLHHDPATAYMRRGAGSVDLFRVRANSVGSGHSMLTLLFAFVGGQAALYFARDDRPRPG